MKNTARIGAGLLIAMCYISLASADGTTTGNYNVTLDIGNGAPTISWINVTPTGLPTQNGITSINASFQADDPNGYGDQNVSSAFCTLQDGATRTSSICYQTPVGGFPTEATYVCPIGLNYYDASGVYNLYCSILDTADGHGSLWSNASFTYGSLTGIAITPATVTFAEMSVGGSSTGSPAITVYNQGNVHIANVSVAAQNLVNLESSPLACTNFNVSIAGSIGTGIPMAASTYKQVPDMNVSIGSGASSPAYVHVHVPIGTDGGTFHSIGDWVLAVFT